MKPHKVEVDAVLKLLDYWQEQGWLDMPKEEREGAAKAVITAHDQARTDRVLYGVAVQGTPCAYIYQPFGNRQEALDWIKRYDLAGVPGLSIGVVPLLSQDRPGARLEEAARVLAELKKVPDPIKPKARRKKAS